jgi:hypothetical protein
MSTTTTITRSTITPSCQWLEINQPGETGAFIRALISYDTTVALYVARSGSDPIKVRIASPSRTTGKHIGLAGCKDWQIVPHARMRELFQEIGITLPCAWLEG